jgi:hypothetical protein
VLLLFVSAVAVTSDCDRGREFGAPCSSADADAGAAGDGDEPTAAARMEMPLISSRRRVSRFCVMLLGSMVHVRFHPLCSLQAVIFRDSVNSFRNKVRLDDANVSISFVLQT